MAWTEQCTIAAVSQIENKIQQGNGVRKSIRMVSKESDIPYGTLRDWYYPINSSGNVPKIRNTNPTPEKFWKSIKNRLSKIHTDIANNNYQIPEDIILEGENLCRLIGIKL